MSSSTSSSEQTPNRVQAVAIGRVLVATAVLVGLWTLARQVFVEPAVFAETNYQSALIRAQDYGYGDAPEVALVGSSVAARVRPDFVAAAGGPSFSNIGLDGASPLVALELVADSPTPPDLVLVEVNLLLRFDPANAVVWNDTVGGITWDLARVFPPVRAEGRPSSVLYSRLKERSDPTSSVPDLPELELSRFRVTTDPTPAADEMTERLGAAVETIVGKGSAVVFVLLPEGDLGGDRRAELGLAAHLAGDQHEVLDLRGLTDELGLGYTDGLHLDARSAQITAAALVTIVDQLG